MIFGRDADLATRVNGAHFSLSSRSFAGEKAGKKLIGLDAVFFGGRRILRLFSPLPSLSLSLSSILREKKVSSDSIIQWRWVRFSFWGRVHPTVGRLVGWLLRNTLWKELCVSPSSSSSSSIPLPRLGRELNWSFERKRRKEEDGFQHLRGIIFFFFPNFVLYKKVLSFFLSFVENCFSVERTWERRTRPTSTPLLQCLQSFQPSPPPPPPPNVCLSVYLSKGNFPPYFLSFSLRKVTRWNKHFRSGK